MKYIFGLIMFVLLNQFVYSQKNDTIPAAKNKKQIIVSSALLVGYASSLTVLNEAWYKNYPKSKFHFFNDNKEWLQMDKLGHLSTAYSISNWGIELMKWSGMKKKSAIWMGGAFGSLYMTTIEVLDGYSSQWGASPGDLLANTLGSGLAVAQQLSTKTYVDLKWSYHESKYAPMRPNLLGGNLPERMLKDYNAQTYWLSFNIENCLKTKRIPSWLNVAIGYSADGMLGGYSNPSNYNGLDFSAYKRTRQYYLSLDLNTKKIKTNNKILKSAFALVNVLKFPFPAIGIENGKIKGYSIYF